MIYPADFGFFLGITPPITQSVALHHQNHAVARAVAVTPFAASQDGPPSWENHGTENLYHDSDNANYDL